MTVDAGLWALLAAIVSGFVTILVARFNTRQALNASREQRDTERDKVDAEAYRRARENYEAANKEQEQRITRLRADREEDRREYERESAELHQECRTLRRQYSICINRMDELASALAELRPYVRTLIAQMRSAGIDPPEPPVSLTNTINPPKR